MPAHPLSPALQSRYRIDRELGRGGMGTVYLATDLRLDRPVALKVLPPEFATDTSLRERFLRETRTAASFSHPNIVPVHAVADDGTSLAFVMGFVEGESLGARVARTGPLDARSVVRLLQTSPTPSPYAHGRGVVHRDISARSSPWHRPALARSTRHPYDHDSTLVPGWPLADLPGAPCSRSTCSEGSPSLTVRARSPPARSSGGGLPCSPSWRWPAPGP